MWLNTFDIVRRHSVRSILLTLFTISGVHCALDISPSGHTLVNAKVGNNVTLTVSISGASDPVVRWFMDSLPVVTWTIGSTTFPPDIAVGHKEILKLETSGSLTFLNVQLEYSNLNYTIEITKAGLGTATAMFTLKVYELIQSVTVNTELEYAEEESKSFTLYYSTLQGEPEQWTWYFNGKEIKDGSHYSVKQRSLVINQPNRNDTGQYSLNLTNPYSSVMTYKNVTVLYGPDEPRVLVSPEEPFYVSGDSVSLSCQSEGFPVPSADWLFGGHILPSSHEGFLHLVNLQGSHQGGVYTCMLRNNQTGKWRQRNVTINVYERPLGSPLCSVHSVSDNSRLQYKCQWPGGTPKALLSFPALDNGSSSGAAEFSLTMPVSQDLSGKKIVCFADHPLQQNNCSVTARGPMAFLPMVSSTIEMNGKILVTIQCISRASPTAVISWSKGNESLTSGMQYQISTDTTQLSIRDFNISSFPLENYTCTCTNPLGSQTRDTRLQGPTISDSSLFPNQDGTIITLTWEVPPTSIVTGFAIQMKGPDLIDTKTGNQAQNKRSSRQFETIQQKPGSTRSTDISTLDPKSTYRFRIIPIVGRTSGEPSEVHRIGPGEGLTGPAIAGIAAGIPCSLLFLILLISLICLCVTCYKKKGQQRSYPKSNVVKAATTHKPPDIMLAPHDLLTGGVKPPPDYNRFHQSDSSERSIPLPTFVPPPPVRFATTV